jgi:hypothetical protein
LKFLLLCDGFVILNLSHGSAKSTVWTFLI